MVLPRVAVIGGGGIGSAITYFLSKHLSSHFGKVICIERDRSLARSSTALSVGGCRQQFSIAESTRLSIFGAEFLRSASDHLTVEGQPSPDVNWRERGYLFLASPAGEAIMRENYATQVGVGASLTLMEPEELKSRFPWLSLDGVALGCLGHKNEGYFDPFSLTQALGRKARAHGAEWVDGHAVALDTSSSGAINAVHVNSGGGSSNGGSRPAGRRVECDVVVNAGGAWAADVVGMAAGLARGLFHGGDGATALPVRPRKRDVFVFHCPDPATWRAPLTADPSGAYFRSDGDGGTFLAGASPPPEADRDVTREEWEAGLQPDHTWFEDVVWPALAERVPAFERIKVKGAWSGLYDYNTVDQNAIVGPHPSMKNLILCNGLSGHGIQHAVGLGRAVAELLVHGSYQTIDLSRFGPSRLLRHDPQPFLERSVI